MTFVPHRKCGFWERYTAAALFTWATSYTFRRNSGRSADRNVCDPHTSDTNTAMRVGSCWCLYPCIERRYIQATLSSDDGCKVSSHFCVCNWCGICFALKLQHASRLKTFYNSSRLRQSQPPGLRKLNQFNLRRHLKNISKLFTRRPKWPRIQNGKQTIWHTVEMDNSSVALLFHA